MRNSIIPIECKVPDASTKDHLITLNEIRDHVYSVKRLENGVSARLPNTLSEPIRKYAENEAVCCPSVAVKIELTDREVDLKITSDNVDMASAIHSLFSAGKQQ